MGRNCLGRCRGMRIRTFKFESICDDLGEKLKELICGENVK